MIPQYPILVKGVSVRFCHDLGVTTGRTAPDFDGVRVRALLVSPIWLPLALNGVERSRVWVAVVRE